MPEYTPTVGDTATFIRKVGVSVRGTVNEVTTNAYLITDTAGHNRTVPKGSIRKILS